MLNINRNWSGALKKSQERINVIADAFYEMFKQKTFSVFHVRYIEKPFPSLECETECEIEKGYWTDGSQHPVKMTENGFMFSCGSYLYINHASDEKEDTCLGSGKNPHFSFQRDRLVVTSRAPAGHIHATMFVITGDMKDGLENHPSYMPSKQTEKSEEQKRTEFIDKRIRELL